MARPAWRRKPHAAPARGARLPIRAEATATPSPDLFVLGGGACAAPHKGSGLPRHPTFSESFRDSQEERQRTVNAPTAGSNPAPGAVDFNSSVALPWLVRNGPYELVTAPENYPGTKYRGKYIYEHHLVWWRRTGQLVPQGFLLHHKNRDKRDNRYRNLELQQVGAHTAEHNRERKQPDVTIPCAWCASDFRLEERNFRFKTNRGQKHFFCCRSHQVCHQHLTRSRRLERGNFGESSNGKT